MKMQGKHNKMPRRTQLPEVLSGSACPEVSDSQGEQPLLCVQWVGPAANKQLHPKWGGGGRTISSAATHGAQPQSGAAPSLTTKGLGPQFKVLLGTQTGFEGNLLQLKSS